MKKLLILAVSVSVLAVWIANQSPAPEATPVAETPQTQETASEEISVTIFPATIRQGEPAMITVTGTTTVKSLTYNGKTPGVFIYEGKPTAFVGIDLKAKAGAYPLVLTLSDNTQIKKNLVVTAREVVEAPLGIPDKLGGNTPQAEQQLVATLAQENAILAAILSTKSMLWNGAFSLPLSNPIVTDHYGYTRLTGASTISHKGTDFRAAIGTPVMAMNSGTVRLAREFRNYGNTIVIDHGFELQTLYMHLSEIDVRDGDTVTKGQVIGKSGMTGYAEQPHLHISIKIGGISVDPIKFVDLF